MMSMFVDEDGNPVDLVEEIMKVREELGQVLAEVDEVDENNLDV